MMMVGTVVGEMDGFGAGRAWGNLGVVVVVVVGYCGELEVAEVDWYIKAQVASMYGSEELEQARRGLVACGACEDG